MFLRTKLDKMSKTIFKNVITILTAMAMLIFPLMGLVGSVQAANGNVIPRELAMFASLAYADLENIKGYSVVMDTNKDGKTKLDYLNRITASDLTFQERPIVTDKQLKSVKTRTSLIGLKKLSDENTYDYLFSGLASTTEVSGWKLVNYAKFNTTILKGAAEFTAMTFKKGNDIVIAYRGTDFDDIGDWIQDLAYGVVNYAGQERVTQDYARLVAEYYAKNNNNINIYVTGHSLGGYLAQIGAAELAGNPEYKDNLKEVIYFNGMGLKFWSNIKSNLSQVMITKFKMNTATVNEILKDNSLLNQTQNIAMNNLNNWKMAGGKIVCYSINGDLISSLGTHLGEQIGLNAHNVCINHHKGNQLEVKNGIKVLLKALTPFLNKDVSKFVDLYKPDDLIGFVWMSHETDSFLGMLPYADGTLPVNISIAIDDGPSQIKYKDTAKIRLVINTTNAKVRKMNWTDFKVSNILRLSIKSVTLKEETKTATGYRYVYEITIKGLIITGKANVGVWGGQIKVDPIKNNITKDAKKGLVDQDVKTKDITVKRK